MVYSIEPRELIATFTFNAVGVNMKFAHMADCHVGAWRDPKLKDINADAFARAVDISIERKVDFVLIAGDLFNTSLPGIDGLKLVVKKLKKLKDSGIKVYAIAGSHDYSPSGKTMIEVLESAGLLVNVVKGDVVDNKLRLRFTVDEKTGAKITGICGKKGMLDRKLYEDLIRDNLENEKGFKIFMFHTALSEFKPKELEKVDVAPLSLLPKNFDYYAGGHVHYVREFKEKGYGDIVFPGPTFPNDFREIEQLQHGGFYIYDDAKQDGLKLDSSHPPAPLKLQSQSGSSHPPSPLPLAQDTVSKGAVDGKLEFIPLNIKNIFSIEINCDGRDIESVLRELELRIKREEFFDTIVTVRLLGQLAKGKPGDIDFKEIFKKINDKGAYYVMKSTRYLESAEFEEIKIDTVSVEDAEDRIINEHLGQIKVMGWNADMEKKMIKALMALLETEKHEGEKKTDFEKRIVKEASEALEIDKV